MASGEKKPLSPGWQKHGVAADAAIEHLSEGGNIGLLTGDLSGGLVVLDADRAWPGFCERYGHIIDLTVTRSNAPERGKVVVRLIDGDVPKSRAYRRKGESKPFLEVLGAGAEPGFGRNPIIAGEFEGGVYELHGDRPAELTVVELQKLVTEWTDDTTSLDPPRKKTTGGVRSHEHSTQRKKGVSLDLEAMFAKIELAALNLEGKRRGDEIEFRCPFHDDRRPSAHYNTVKHVFSCKACGQECGWRELAKKLGVPTGDGNHDGSTERVLPRIIEIDRLSQTAPWPGRTGGTDQAVLHAILAVAYREKRLAVGVDYRTISLAAKVSLGTVGNATKRLQEKRGWRWLFREKRGEIHLNREGNRNSSGTVWRVALPIALRRKINCRINEHSEATKAVENVQVCDTLDAAVWWSLPKNALRLWKVLSAGVPTTGKELRQQLCLHRSSIPRLLRTLEAATDDTGQSLAIKDGKGWRRGAGDPQRVVLPAGTERRTRYKARYKRDREEHLPAVIEAMRQRRSQKRQPTGDVYTLHRRPGRWRQACDRERSDYTNRPIPVLVSAMSCDQIGQRLVAWLLAVRTSEQAQRMAA